MSKSLSYNEFPLSRPGPKKPANPAPLKELQEHTATRVAVSGCNFSDVTEAEKEWDEIETQFRAILIRAEADIEKWAIRAKSFRDRRGYRLMGYRSWELFCSKRLKFTSSWINIKIKKSLPAPPPDQDEIGAEAGSDPTQEIPPDDQENAATDQITPIDDSGESEEKPQTIASLESKPPKPDPWQSVKQEVASVYGEVTKALKELKDQIAIARGYNVFEFVGAIEQDMNNIKQTLAAAKPTQVCETCRPGSPAQAKNCRVCHGVGMVPKCVNERQRTPT